MPASQPHPDDRGHQTAKPSDEKSGAERRRWTRARAEWPITIQLEDGPHHARVRDISRAGVCFFLDRPLPLMTQLRVQLELPVNEGVRHITGSGAVVRSEQISQAIDHYEIAVFLQDMAEPDRDSIAEYVSHLKSMPAKEES